MSDLFLLRKSLRDLIRPNRLVVAILLAIIPVAIAALERAFDTSYDPVNVYNTLSTTLVYAFVLTILSVVFCTDVIAQEVEQKTIVYLLTRAMPRWRILLIKFSAALIGVIVTSSAACALLAVVAVGPSHLSSTSLGRDLAVLPLGALAYGAVSLLLATFMKRPMMAGILFAFGWETWVPNMQGAFQRLSIMTYLHTLSPHVAAPPASLTPALDAGQQAPLTLRLALTVLVMVCITALGFSLIIFSNREYAPREDTE